MSYLHPIRMLGALCMVVGCGVDAAGGDEKTADHCTNNGGDSYCAERFPGLPLCNSGEGECSIGDRFGCVEEVAEQCHAPCGEPGDLSCVEGEDSGSETGTSGSETGSSGSETGSSGTTTGDELCVGDGDCMDAEAPFCDPDGVCVGCDGMADGDAACAGVDAGLPLCVGGACVACSAEDSSVCDGQLLLCDAEANACVGCVAHEECGSGACELAVGRCFVEGMVVHVDGDGGQDFLSVSAAVGSVEDGMSGVIVVHETMGLGYAEVTIDAGKTIALLAAPGEAPIIQGTGGSPGVLVQGAGAILYIEGLGLSLAAAQGLVVDEGLAWVDRSRIVQNTGGGVLAQNGAELVLRNCFVGGDASDTDAMVVDASTVDVLYTTIIAGSGLGESRALLCSGASTVLVRNGIMVAADDGNSEVVCPMADVSYSATEEGIPGTGNTMLGDLQLGWFADLSSDFHLGAMAPKTLDTTAQWQEGDPSTDIDGDPRPNTDGALDYAGADVP